MRGKGFTLVEVMVTMAVIGMLALTVSFVVPDRRDNNVEEQARVLYERLKYAREYAIVRSTMLGLRIDDGGSRYQFVQFIDDRWQAINHRGLRDTELDQHLSLLIETADLALLAQDDTNIDDVFKMDDDDQLPPQLLIFGSGDLAPFNLTVRDDFALRAGTSWLISSDNGFDIHLERGQP